MMRRLAAWSLLVAVTLLVAACTSSGSANPSPAISAAPASETLAEAGDGGDMPVVDSSRRTYRIVTMGDVYTYGLGTDTPGRDGWPFQMVTSLRQHGDMRIRLFNLADDSSSTVEVIDSQLASVSGYQPDVVTLQVGVDDIVGGETASYAENVAHILDELLLVVPADRIFVVTTPDHTLTEWGHASTHRGTHDEVEAINADLVEEATTRGITVIDIGPVNERVTVDDTLVVQASPPRPYPTAKQYAAWAEVIGRHVRDALETIEP